MAESAGFLSVKGEGKVHQVLGVSVRVKAGGGDVGGRSDVLEAEFPPSVGFPPHVHHQSDEAFYVLEGELAVRVGDRTVTASAGSFGLAPKGLVHGFENKGASSAKVLVWQTPPTGVEKMMEELSQLPPGPPDMEKLLPILKTYDTEPVVPPGP